MSQVVWLGLLSAPWVPELTRLPASRANFSKVTSPASFSYQLFENYSTLPVTYVASGPLVCMLRAKVCVARRVTRRAMLRMLWHIMLRVRLRVVFTSADFDLNVCRAGVGLVVLLKCVCSAGC